MHPQLRSTQTKRCWLCLSLDGCASSSRRCASTREDEKLTGGPLAHVDEKASLIGGDGAKLHDVGCHILHDACIEAGLKSQREVIEPVLATEKIDRTTSRHRRMWTPGAAPHPTRPRLRRSERATPRCSNGIRTGQRTSSSAGVTEVAADRTPARCSKDMLYTSELSGAQAQALERDAGATHCSDSPHSLKEQGLEKQTVGRQFFSSFIAREATRPRREYHLRGNNYRCKY